MRVLFDQATPVPIRPFLKGHTVRTAAQEKWDRLRNGELLNAAETSDCRAPEPINPPLGQALGRGGSRTTKDGPRLSSKRD
jgi:hypothetical protein